MLVAGLARKSIHVTRTFQRGLLPPCQTHHNRNIQHQEYSLGWIGVDEEVVLREVVLLRDFCGLFRSCRDRIRARVKLLFGFLGRSRHGLVRGLIHGFVFNWLGRGIQDADIQTFFCNQQVAPVTYNQGRL